MKIRRKEELGQNRLEEEELYGGQEREITTSEIRDRVIRGNQWL